MDLAPLAACEAEAGEPSRDWRTLWLKGGFPDALSGDHNAWWELGAALGVSFQTVQRHLGVLERIFLLRRLPSLTGNVGKRLVKAPKLYLRDTGLLHHLLGIRSHGELESHPVRGASWETFVIEDVLRREALGDIGAGRGWIVDQGEGIERLDSAIARAGFAEVIRGVPE